MIGRSEPSPLHLFPSLLLLASTFMAGAEEAELILEEANDAFTSHRIGEALEKYRDASLGDLSGEETAFANRRVALIEWRYFGKMGRARKTIRSSLGDSAHPTRLLLELAALETAAGRWEEAREAASRAMLLARTSNETRLSRLAWARATAEESAEQESESLAAAKLVASRILDDGFGDVDASDLLIRTGILSGDGKAVLRGWRSYFRVADDGEPYETLGRAWISLQAALDGWEGDDPEANARVVDALAASRFYDEALLLARQFPMPEELSESTTEALAFAEMAAAWREATDEYYRRTAIGEGDVESWIRLLMREMRERWEGLGLPLEKPEIPSEPGMEALGGWLRGKGPQLQELFLERFGAVINIGSTAGYFDLHMGYVVLDEERQIEQYGEAGAIRFQLLDRMVSNGFQSWAWNFGAQHGGWASDEVITQVRPVYLKGPDRYWRMLTDPEERREWEERIERLSKTEQRTLEENPLSNPPGAEARLQKRAIERALRELERSGLTDTDLRAAFLRRIEKIIQDHSIFAHEGRHVIDKRLGVSGSEELEFRAKLSEVAFSELPGLALSGAILGHGIGDPTPHGQANLRVLTAIVSWMKENRDQIDSFDDRQPTASQIDKLTDDQLRAAVRSVDPLLSK